MAEMPLGSVAQAESTFWGPTPAAALVAPPAATPPARAVAPERGRGGGRGRGRGRGSWFKEGEVVVSEGHGDEGGVSTCNALESSTRTCCTSCNWPRAPRYSGDESGLRGEVAGRAAARECSKERSTLVSSSPRVSIHTRRVEEGTTVRAGSSGEGSSGENAAATARTVDVYTHTKAHEAQTRSRKRAHAASPRACDPLR